MSASEQLPSKPDWLDDEFVQNCVKNDVGALSIDDVVVHDVSIEYAIPKGENYSSLILRLKVKADVYDKNRNTDMVNSKHNNGLKYEDTNGKVKRYIIKILHEYEFMKQITEELALFAKEVDMYRNMMPKFQTLLKKAGLETTFSCRCLHVHGEQKLLVLEDLGAQNYVLADRVRGTDLEHTKLALFKMARLHGASLKYFHKNDLKDVPEYYFKPILCEIEDEKIRAVIDPIMGSTAITKKIYEMLEVLNKRAEYEEESQIINEIATNAFKTLCGIVKFHPDSKLNTLIHGDFWINNMLFKYNDAGKPIDVMLVDMQCSYFSNITVEFLHFFLSSASDEIREHHFNDMVNFYHQNLIDTLDKVEYKGIKPTIQQFKDDLVTSSPLFLFYLPTALPLLKTEFSAANDRSESEFIKLQDAFEIGMTNRHNPVYIKTLFTTIGLLKEIGTFEYLKKLLKVYQN